MSADVPDVGTGSASAVQRFRGACSLQARRGRAHARAQAWRWKLCNSPDRVLRLAVRRVAEVALKLAAMKPDLLLVDLGFEPSFLQQSNTSERICATA